MGFRGDIIAEGDDGIIGMDDLSHIPRMVRMYADFGLEIKFDVHEGLHGADFCKVTF